MKQQRITFLMSRFLDGGIDTVLLEYLHYLSLRGQYETTLAIAQGLGELEVYKDRLPKNIKVRYLVEDGWLTSVPKRKIRSKVGGVSKLLDQIFVNPIRRWKVTRGIKALSQQTDLFIDFDTCAYSYLKSVQTPSIAFFHFSFEQVLKQNPRRMRRIGAILPRYKYVISISEGMREEGERLFPELSGKIKVLYNPKDPYKLHEMSESCVEDERILRPYILAVGRLEESQKDFTTLLKSYAQLCRSQRITEDLYIIGKGRDEAKLQQLSQDLGIADRVQFLGFMDNPYPWMKRCRLFVHSAKFEGLPTVMIEALMFGKLIVASDCPTGPKEILECGRSGALVPVGDAVAMADQIERLLAGGAEVQRMQAAVERSAERFTFEAIGEQLQELLRGEG